MQPRRNNQAPAAALGRRLQPWQELPEKTVIDSLHTGEEDRETCRRLVDAANDAGGSDNITVMVAR